jgi:hypothetical protein
MAKKIPDMPMAMQPAARSLTAATQMLPAMPMAGAEAKKVPARKNAAKRQPTRTEAVQAAKANIKANIKRRNSAQETAPGPEESSQVMRPSSASFG